MVESVAMTGWTLCNTGEGNWVRALIGVAGDWSSCCGIDAMCLREQATTTLSDFDGRAGADLVVVSIAEDMEIIRPGMFWT